MQMTDYGRWYEVTYFDQLGDNETVVIRRNLSVKETCKDNSCLVIKLICNSKVIKQFFRTGLRNDDRFCVCRFIGPYRISCRRNLDEGVEIRFLYSVGTRSLLKRKVIVRGVHTQYFLMHNECTRNDYQLAGRDQILKALAQDVK